MQKEGVKRVFDSTRPTKSFPSYISEAFRIGATDLRATLKHQRLIVVLAPAPEPRHSLHMVRVVEQHNPDWYRKLYHDLPNFRRDLSMIALERIEDGTDKVVQVPWKHRTSNYRYDVYYRELIFKRLIKGYNENGIYISQHEEVCIYFGEPYKKQRKEEPF